MRHIANATVRALLLLACTLPLPAQTTSDETLSPSTIYKNQSHAVVLIEMKDDKGKVTKTGSGFLVSADGKILTNYHVIAHSKQGTVRLDNDDAYDRIDVLDIDKRKDIALIKIKAVDLPAVTLGRSSTVEVGQKVYSLTTPLGMLQNTLSEGIISGIRPGDGYRYFQISAPISHGSSGGPIFNTKGEVIGVAVMTISEGQNLNFAVPIDYARGMLTSNQLQTLASVYEPEPEPEKPEQPQKVAQKIPTPAEEMVKDTSFVYLEHRLGKWTKQNADEEMGPVLGQRDSTPANQATIYSYDDPTKLWRSFELTFNNSSHLMTNVYAYPWNLTWDECKRLWGDNTSLTKMDGGIRFYHYRDRRLDVLTNKTGQVINVGVY